MGWGYVWYPTMAPIVYRAFQAQMRGQAVLTYINGLLFFYIQGGFCYVGAGSYILGGHCIEDRGTASTGKHFWAELRRALVGELVVSRVRLGSGRSRQRNGIQFPSSGNEHFFNFGSPTPAPVFRT
jgi:hypothetical protein